MSEFENENDIDISYEMCNGLLPSTYEDLDMFHEMISKAISFPRQRLWADRKETGRKEDMATEQWQYIKPPISVHWQDINDDVKVYKWDSEWEKYIKDSAELIDNEGRESYLPWNIYKSLGLKWVDGYALRQQDSDCCSFGHRNSMKASALTIALRTGLIPKCIAHSVTYAIARGYVYPNWRRRLGEPNYGPGLNLNPMSKYACEIGNYWTDDFGPYDNGKHLTKYRKGSQQDENALKTQSVVVPLPQPNFEYCYAACAAGFGINIGVTRFPSGSKLNSGGFAQAANWMTGSHSVALIAAWKASSGHRYIFLENSHGQKYAADRFSDGQKQWGCWIDEDNFKSMNGTFGLGTWYVNLCELGGQ